MTKLQYFSTVLVMGLLCTVSPFSIDMYLPGFPAIVKDLDTTMDMVQLSLTSYFIGIALGQLVYGPLLDRFGRKKPLYAGLIIYILASIACAFTSSIQGLVIMRFVQAVGGCAGMVAAQALVRDLFPVNKTAQIFSLLVLVIAVSPMIAPTAGGYLVTAYGWHSVFLLLALLTALIMVSVYFILPQGQVADRSLSLKPKAVLKNYIEVFKNQQFLIYSLAGGIATAAPFAYIAGSADTFINIYGVTEHQYGWIFAILASAMIGSTQLNHIFLKYLSSQQLIKASLIYQTGTSLVMLAGYIFGFLELYSIIVLLFIFLTGQGLNMPNATALTLEPFEKNAGSASALMGCLRMGMGGVVSAAVSLLHNGTVLPMIVVMGICACAGLAILLIGQHQVGKVDKEKAAFV